MELCVCIIHTYNSVYEYFTNMYEYIYTLIILYMNISQS